MKRWAYIFAKVRFVYETTRPYSGGFCAGR